MTASVKDNKLVAYGRGKVGRWSGSAVGALRKDESQ